MKKPVWVFLAIVAAVVTLLVSCGPSGTATTTTTPQVTTSAPPKTTTTAPPSDKPKYGGVINILTNTNLAIFGAAVSNRGPGQDGYVLEQITQVDRTRGPAGSGISDFAENAVSMDDVVGKLAEKWATPAVGVWVLDIRHGVHFANTGNPNFPASTLVNGREMTADDVKASLEFLRDTPSSWVNVAEPTLIKNMTVEKTGPWQVTVKTPVSPNTGYLWLMGGGGQTYIWPKEYLDKYGTNNDWHNTVGTGPFILTDWVDSSVANYKRNANYWDKNPVGPGKGDQLPYADGVKYFVVPDTSTQLAAFRTGKADWLTVITQREDYNTLTKTNPDIKGYKSLIVNLQVGMRRDKQDLPFKDLRVRQALMLATDKPGILKGLFGGEGELLDSPARKLYTSVYTPLDKLSPTIQELFGYNPDKAKKLLADAGYPSGFKTKMLVSNLGFNVDMAQTIKAQWAKVGVDVEIQLREDVVFRQIWTTRSYDELMLTDLCGGQSRLFERYSFGYYRGPNSYNISYVDDPAGSDPIVEKAFQDQSKVIMVDYPAADKIIKDLIPYLLEQSFLIPMPAPYGYRIWQPWIKNYYGEGSTKHWLQYAWVDQDLKEKMTGNR